MSVTQQDYHDSNGTNERPPSLVGEDVRQHDTSSPDLGTFRTYGCRHRVVSANSKPKDNTPSSQPCHSVRGVQVIYSTKLVYVSAKRVKTLLTSRVRDTHNRSEDNNHELFTIYGIVNASIHAKHTVGTYKQRVFQNNRPRDLKRASAQTFSNKQFRAYRNRIAQTCFRY